MFEINISKYYWSKIEKNYVIEILILHNSRTDKNAIISTVSAEMCISVHGFVLTQELISNKKTLLNVRISLN